MASMTPGPWKLCGSMNGTVMRIIPVALEDDVVAINGGKGCIAEIKLPRVGMVEALADERSEEMANAVAIAAAPEMLAALQELLDAHIPTTRGGGLAANDMWHQRRAAAFDQARAAIAKAKGG